MARPPAGLAAPARPSRQGAGGVLGVGTRRDPRAARGGGPSAPLSGEGLATGRTCFITCLVFDLQVPLKPVI